MLLEDWIDVWSEMLDDIEPTTLAKYRYLVELHIPAEFQGRQLGSLTFDEIEAWDRSIRPHQCPWPPVRPLGRGYGAVLADHDSC